ncbi:MAG: hypothetical protein JOZ96_04055 [Acidobacteria bacterium]|nr:hypothetical protein [Acidobacteriota bacterium]
MPRAKGKKKGAARPAASDAPDVSDLNLLRAGMPAADSITGVEQMERGGKVFRIIKTREVDAYDEPPKPERRRRTKR